MSRKVYELKWDESSGSPRAVVYKQEDEYCVKFFKRGVHREAADYFTGDKKDALGTAFLELERMSKES